MTVDGPEALRDEAAQASNKASTPSAEPQTKAKTSTKTKAKTKTSTKTKTSKNDKNDKHDKNSHALSTSTLLQVLSCGVLLVQRVPFPAVLALLRHDGSPDLPKGHVKRGEADVAAALRELTEETGIPARSVRLDETFVFESTYRTRSKRTGLPVKKTVRLFLGEVDGPARVMVSDHSDYAWLRLDHDDAALERELKDNPTFLGALRAWRGHQAQNSQKLSRVQPQTASVFNAASFSPSSAKSDPQELP